MSYKNIRRNWYAGVKKKMRGMSAGMKEALDRVLVNADGCILSSLLDLGSERVLSAWSAVAGRIPIISGLRQLRKIEWKKVSS